MVKAEIFVGFVNKWQEGKPAQAYYHAFLEINGRAHIFHTWELEQLLTQAQNWGKFLQQNHLSEYNIINGYRLVDTPWEKNARCPSDYLTTEELEHFKDTLEEALGMDSHRKMQK